MSLLSIREEFLLRGWHGLKRMSQIPVLSGRIRKGSFNPLENKLRPVFQRDRLFGVYESCSPSIEELKVRTTRRI